MRFIVLFGPKHSGKTTVGRELASLLSCRFTDLDEFIAERSGKTPRTLYTEGPEIFRKAEAEALASLFESALPEAAPETVIATGGGIADNPIALALFEQRPEVMSVFLDVSVQTAWERINKEDELPPFLRTDNPRETHRLLHERRAAVYRRIASRVIQADGKSPGEIAREILKQIPIYAKLTV